MPPRHFFLDCVPPFSAVISMNALDLPRRHAAGYALSSLQDASVVCSKDFLKLRARLRHPDVFYRGLQASLLGSPTT
jgi:hypothetical protein